MRNRTVVITFAALVCAAFSGVSFAAEEAVEAEKFDQEAVLMELWKAPDDAVVGSVDGINVTKREVLKTLWFWQAPNMLQDLLNQKMIKQAAADANVELTWAEVQQKVQEGLKQTNATDVDQLLAQVKITKQRFMSVTKLRALAEKVARSQIEIPDSDYADWIKARHILVAFPQDEKDKDKREEIAKTRIDEVAAKLKAGEDFAKLADEYSEDPTNEAGGVKKGGDLGWFTRGGMVQEFEKVAFDLEVGKVGEPVKTFYGYHLIRVDKLGKDASPEEKAELNEKIIAKKVPMEMGRWFSNLQANSEIDNKLAGPPVKTPPQPTMIQPRPRPAPRPAPRTAPSPQPPKPAPKPSEPPASPKPETPPPPPPPPAPEE